MLSNERKKELYHGWCKKSDWTEEEERAWKALIDSLDPEEREYLEHINSLEYMWNISAGMDDEEYREWYGNLNPEDKILVDEWDEREDEAFRQLCRKMLQMEIKGDSRLGKTDTISSKLSSAKIAASQNQKQTAPTGNLRSSPKEHL